MSHPIISITRLTILNWCTQPRYSRSYSSSTGSLSTTFTALMSHQWTSNPTFCPTHTGYVFSLLFILAAVIIKASNIHLLSTLNFFLCSTLKQCLPCLPPYLSFVVHPINTVFLFGSLFYCSGCLYFISIVTLFFRTSNNYILPYSRITRFGLEAFMTPGFNMLIDGNLPYPSGQYLRVGLFEVTASYECNLGR